jgi:hypothetical protein
VRPPAFLFRTLLAALPIICLFATATAQPARDPSFEIVNASGRIVFQIFANAVTERDWGRDHLGAGTLRPGQSFQVRLPPEGGCLTDIRVVFQGGAAIERRRVDTCTDRWLVIEATAITSAPAGQAPGQPPSAGGKGGGAGPQPPPTTPQPPPAGPVPGRPGGAAAQAPRGNPSFWIVNNSRRTMRELYAAPSSQGSWGPDRFGTGVLAGGDRFAVRLPEGECLYDVRVVWVDGRIEDRRRINLCEVIELVYE